MASIINKINKRLREEAETEKEEPKEPKSEAPKSEPKSEAPKPKQKHSNDGWPPEHEIGPAVGSVNRELKKEKLSPISHDHYRVIMRGPPGYKTHPSRIKASQATAPKAEARKRK